MISATLPLLAELMRLQEIRRRKSEIASAREARKRLIWSDEKKKHGQRMFYRSFRMKKTSFDRLCHKIESAVGPSVFKQKGIYNAFLSLNLILEF